MSKKKAFTGSTMTLKDFHGGSIPSDLPLPSAPGIVVRTSDRSVLDRQIQGTWGNPINRSDHRSRPGSSGATRNFDEKASFLSHPAHIGRNFDEDERKPFDSAPRRIIADDEPQNPAYEDRQRVGPRVPSNRLDPKLEPASVLFSGRPQPNLSFQASNAPVQQSLGVSNFSDHPKSSGISVGSSQISGKWSCGSNSHFQGSSSAQVGATSVPNAWAAKKEPGLGLQEPSFNEQMPPSTWSGPSAVSKFAQASALEKVSSGRWQSKLASTAQQSQQLIYQSGVDVLRFSDSANTAHSRENMHEEGGRLSSFRQTKVEFSAVGERENRLINTEAYDLGPDRGDFGVENRRIECSMQVRCGEKARVVEDRVQVNEEFLDYERARSPLHSDAKERNRGSPSLECSLSGASHSSQVNSGFYSDGGRPTSTDGKLGGWTAGSGSSHLQSHPEISERPKLKLFPRTRSLEPSELHIVDHKQSYQQPANSAHVQITNEAFGNTNPPKPGSAGAEGGNRAVDRPKLNLKPRSQTFEQSDENIERERKALFGGARPRELVLKERGIDDVVITNLDMSQPASHRGKHEPAKSEPAKPESYLVDQKAANRPGDRSDFQADRRDLERKDHRTDGKKADSQRSSRRNEHWRNGRETEKQQEREPESWRKPVEPVKLGPPSLASDTPAPRYGRASSALELAQAFSRSVSDTGAADRFSNQGQFSGCPGGSSNLPGRNPVPFSRLTETREFYSSSAQRQINGY